MLKLAHDFFLSQSRISRMRNTTVYLNYVSRFTFQRDCKCSFYVSKNKLFLVKVNKCYMLIQDIKKETSVVVIWK